MPACVMAGFVPVSANLQHLKDAKCQNSVMAVLITAIHAADPTGALEEEAHRVN